MDSVNNNQPAQPLASEVNAAIALYNAGRFAELESRARLLVDQFPDFGFGWKLLGGALQMQGKNALSAFQKTAELMPNEADAHYNLGIALKDFGLLADAAASYRRALKIKPDYAEAHSNLGNVLKDLGQPGDAVTSYRRALRLKPDSAEAHNNLGTALKDLGQLDDAVDSYRIAVKIKPGYAEAYFNLGNVLKELGRLDDAATAYRTAVEIKPDFADAHNNLGVALNELGKLDAAEASYRSAIRIKPDFAQAHSNLGVVLCGLEQHDDAAECYRRALEIDPKCIEAMIGTGQLCMENGDLAEAEKLCQKVLETKPDNLDARFLLAQAKKTKRGDNNLAALEAVAVKVLNSNSPMPYNKIIPLHFALGKCFDDLGDYDRAFRHYLQGCELKRTASRYDAGKMTQNFDSVMRVFDRTTLARLQGAGDPSSVPIFVLGMPRSGTTLTEQIIASHPAVYGAGELTDLMAIAQRDIAGTGALFPDNILALDQSTLGAWASEYVAGLRRRAPDAWHVTNKSTTNYFCIGLIHLMLPNAKIIHVNRNPVDTCLSCFMQLFTSKQEHTYDLAELGRYYADYARLMAHWRQVLPAGTFLEVRYEDLVADNEAQARRLIAYCGLEWNDACLRSHETKRSIRTASVTQVRQPIYTSSVERWRRYEQYLGPLLDALGDLAQQRN